MTDYTTISLSRNSLWNTLPQKRFAAKNKFHLSGASLQLNYTGYRFFIPEVYKYVSHVQCIKIGKVNCVHRSEQNFGLKWPVLEKGLNYFLKLIIIKFSAQKMCRNTALNQRIVNSIG